MGMCREGMFGVLQIYQIFFIVLIAFYFLAAIGVLTTQSPFVIAIGILYKLFLALTLLYFYNPFARSAITNHLAPDVAFAAGFALFISVYSVDLQRLLQIIGVKENIPKLEIDVVEIKERLQTTFFKRSPKETFKSGSNTNAGLPPTE